jgi:hypothetical protein
VAFFVHKQEARKQVLFIVRVRRCVSEVAARRFKSAKASLTSFSAVRDSISYGKPCAARSWQPTQAAGLLGRSVGGLEALAVLTARVCPRGAKSGPPRQAAHAIQPQLRKLRSQAVRLPRDMLHITRSWNSSLFTTKMMHGLVQRGGGGWNVVMQRPRAPHISSSHAGSSRAEKPEVRHSDQLKTKFRRKDVSQ